MATTRKVGDLRTHAAAIAERLADGAVAVPKALAPHAREFAALQARFESAAVAADVALDVRDEALAAIGEADDLLDASVDDYADAVAGARLGPRANPFGAYSKYGPGKMKQLAYAVEPREVRALVAAIGRKRPPSSVIRVGNACLAHAGAVEQALRAFAKPAAAYTKALAARDALLPELQKAIKTLEAHAGSALVDDPGTLKALLGKPETVRAPKKRRAAKAAAPADDGAAPTPG